MIASAYIGLLLVNSILASNDAYFAKGWVPVSRSFVFNQMSNSDSGTSHYNDWKPSKNIDDSNIDLMKENAIQLVIAPEQTKILPNEKNIKAGPGHGRWPPPADTAVVPTRNVNRGQEDSQHSSTALSQKNATDASDATEPNQDQDQILLKSKSINKMQKDNVLVKTDLHRRASKQIWDLSSTEDFPLNFLITSEPSVKATEFNKSIHDRNTTYNNYEVTELSNDQDFGQEMNGLRYEYTNKFVRHLSKYDIKDDDKLSNYARSKRRLKKPLYPPNVSSVSLIPFRYNSMNHLPADPLLAVLLSNYGYYLHRFYGLQNNYKNLYGYSASNNIHNNKPFGSYKIFSDTDSSN